jgi:DNA-binding NarL/FixJ family response regulator
LLTATLSEHEALEAKRLGVRGMILKEMSSHLLIQCVRKVHAGEQWIEPHAMGKALDKLLRREVGTQELARILTPREIEIMHQVASGLRNKEIAEQMFISEGTVKTHLHSIFKKLHINSRLALLSYAHKKELV